MLNRNVFLNLYTMVRSSKKSIILLGGMLFLLNGCYTYTEFRHPQNGSDGEPLELGDVHLQNGCIECHQEAFSGTTTILPDGVKGKKAWEFFYQTAWWEDSYDLPPIRTQYIDYDDPSMITGPAVPSGVSGASGLAPVHVPAATTGPVFIPTNVGGGKVAIPSAGSSSSSASDDRRDSQRGGSQSYTPAARSSRGGSDSSSSDNSSSSVGSDNNNSSSTSSRRESNSGGSRGSERRR